MSVNLLAAFDGTSPVGKTFALGNAYSGTAPEAERPFFVSKAAVRIAIPSQVALSGVTNNAVFGVAIHTGDFVLLCGQTDPTQNGVYIVTAGNPILTTDITFCDALPGAVFGYLLPSKHKVTAGVLANAVFSMITPIPPGGNGLPFGSAMTYFQADDTGFDQLREPFSTVSPGQHP